MSRLEALRAKFQKLGPAKMPKDEGIEFIQLLRASARDVKKVAKKKESPEERRLREAQEMFKALGNPNEKV